jgi:hypothetical protein
VSTLWRFRVLRRPSYPRTSSYTSSRTASSRPSAEAGSANPRRSYGRKKTKKKYIDRERFAGWMGPRNGGGQTECAPTFEPGVGVAHFDASVAIAERAVLDLLERVLRAEGVRPPARTMRYPQQIAAERHLGERYF